MDRLTAANRSALMSRIGSKNTLPEMVVRKFVPSLGYRYRLHAKDLPGKPDLVFRKQKKVIFVHGCFWHAHFCRKGQPPKSKLNFWGPKLKANAERDARVLADLKELGWDSLVIWQCEIREPASMWEKIELFLT